MRWLVTLLVVLILAGVALSAPWWLPQQLAPYMPDAASVESMTLVIQLALWILAGMAGFVGIRWARQRRAPAYQEPADDRTPTLVEVYEAEVRATEAGESPTTDRPPTLTAPGPEGAATTDPGQPELGTGDSPLPPGPPPGPETPAGTETGLADSLFGTGGALPPGRLASQPPQDADHNSTLSDALFRQGGPLPAGSLTPLGWSAPGEEMDGDLTGDLLDMVEDPRFGRHPVPGAEAPYAASVSPPAGLQAHAFSLPVDLPDFVGREGEMGAVRTHLKARDRLAVSILTGMPGVGKTALALHLAHRLAAEGYYPDAQLFVDLKGTAPEPMAPARALSALLTALLGADLQRPDDEDTLSQLWRQALQTRRALLVLDNAAGAAQVQPLLPGSPGSAVIITSQHHFTLPGAERFELGPLPQAEASAFLQALAPRLTAEEAGELASLVGRLPLALRVASNNLALNDDLSPADYVAAARQEAARLELLSDPGEPGLDVGTSLSAGIDGCRPITRQSWALLGCLPAPFTVAAAAALWGDGDPRTAWEPLTDSEARNRLRSLRHMSLLAYDPDTDRFGQHVLLRLAAGRASEQAADVASAHQRLACHFLTVAQAIDTTQRYMDLDRDWPHLRSALEHTRLQDRELFSDLVLALNNYWSARGMARERATWNERAAKAYAATRSDAHLAPPPAGQPAAGPDDGMAGAGASELSGQRKVGVHLGHVGAAYYEMGQPQRAIEVYGQAIYASRTSGDQAAEAAHLSGVGRAYAALGDTERAVDYQHQAIDLHRAAGNAQGEMTALGALGQAYVRLGDARRGIGYLQRAVAMAQGLEDHRAEGLWLGELALAYTELGDLHQAIQNQEQALSCVRSAGDLPGEAAQLASLGWSYARIGNGAPPVLDSENEQGTQAQDADTSAVARDALTRAQELWDHALDLFDALGDPRGKEVRSWLAELDT